MLEKLEKKFGRLMILGRSCIKNRLVFGIRAHVTQEAEADWLHAACLPQLVPPPGPNEQEDDHGHSDDDRKQCATGN